MTLLQDIQDQSTAALKAGNRVRVSTLRMLISAVKNAAISKYGADSEKKLTDADVLETIKKQVKTHRESIEAFRLGNRQDLVASEQAELTILEAYLPKELSDEELKKTLEPVLATGEKNFGLLMKQAMAAVAGKVDGGRVAAMMKQLV